MTPNIPASQKCAVVAAIDPDALAANTYLSGWVAAKDFANFMAVIMAGTLGTNATLDAKIRQATDGSGTGAKDISGKAITQLTQAGTDDSDQQAVIDVKPADLDIANGFTHIAISLTVATATSDAGAVLLGLDPVRDFASDADSAAVAEVVV